MRCDFSITHALVAVTAHQLLLSQAINVGPGAMILSVTIQRLAAWVERSLRQFSNSLSLIPLKRQNTGPITRSGVNWL
jgi:hypothetical protein